MNEDPQVADAGGAGGAAWLRVLVVELAGVGRRGESDRELLAALTELERVKAAAAAAQVRVTAAFAASQEAAAQAAQKAAKEQGFEAWQAARDAYRDSRSTAAQVALARRMSPWQAARTVNVARVLTGQLTGTLAALEAGVISESRAAIVVRETRYLDIADRVGVDQEITADLGRLAHLGERGLERAVKAAGYRRNPQAVLARARAAERERQVGIRPLPDAMCRLSALLPLAQGVATYAALSQQADTARAQGEQRTRGQVMADTLVERVTGQGTASAVPVEVQVVLSDAALLGLSDEPGQVPGYGAVPAGWARELIRGSVPDGTDERIRPAQVWLRRLYARPDSSTLVAMETRRRRFEAGLRRFLLARDGTCRTPWCDAPVRHLDHVRAAAAGGSTSATNGQGLCERCNHTKQLPGWRTEVVSSGRGPHQVRWTTPTGAIYHAQAPPLLPIAVTSPEPTPRLDLCRHAPASPIELDLAGHLAA